MTDTAAPPLKFPEPVRRDLDAHRPGLADVFERTMASHVRPCVAITAQRVSGKPLRRNPLARLFGAPATAPVLGVMESKFGGTPYCEVEEDWNQHTFLGQIDLARATTVLPPDTVRLTGLLRLDLRSGAGFSEALRVRWFPRPQPDRAVAATPESVGKWEARLAFALAWTLPEGAALDALWPLPEHPWYQYNQFDPPGYNGDGFDQFHRMLGHKSGGLDEHHGFRPPPGCTDDIAAYECLLRLTFDGAAGFSWGTNWIYLLVPREDLAGGDLSRVVVTGANS